MMHMVKFAQCFCVISHYFWDTWTPNQSMETLHTVLLPYTFLGAPQRKQLLNKCEGKQRGDATREAGRRYCCMDGRKSVQSPEYPEEPEVDGQRGAKCGDRGLPRGCLFLPCPTLSLSDFKMILQVKRYTKPWICFLFFQVFTCNEEKIIINSSHNPKRSYSEGTIKMILWMFCFFTLSLHVI